MNTLTITQRSILKRRHGITVRIESQGVAKVWLPGGQEDELSIGYLQSLAEQHIAQPGIAQRVRRWMLGGAV